MQIKVFVYIIYVGSIESLDISLKLNKWRVIVELYIYVYIWINLKLYDSEHVCSEENFGPPDMQWRTKLREY